MSIAITEPESTMLKKILLASSTAAAALGFSSGAFADPPRWAPAHGWRAHHHGHYEHYEQYRPHYYYAPRPVYVVPAPHVVYAHPAPVVVPAPMYPAPLVSPYGGNPSVSIRLNFPL